MKTQSHKNIIIITGSIASGKSSVLSCVYKSLKKHWRCCGMISHASTRLLRSKKPSLNYKILTLPDEKRYDWAGRASIADRFNFNDDTRRIVEASTIDELESNPDVCFLDEIGRLEVRGDGFSGLFREVLASQVKTVVAVVRKDVLDNVLHRFGIESPRIVDLDTVPVKKACTQVRRMVAMTDSERIGVYSGIAGAVEVGLGSTLHAYHVPAKGHLLAYIQTILLINFGNQLNGRGLVRISFITAMLKAFSPMGRVLMPMFYIFSQGAVFAAPTRLFGWSSLTAGVGAVLMAWFTLGMSLGKDYLLFGSSIFNAYAEIAATVSGWLGIEQITLLQLIIGLFILKALIAIPIAALAYHTHLASRLREWVSRRKSSPRPLHSPTAQPARSKKHNALLALRDITRLKFILSLFISILLIAFFAKLSTGELVGIFARAASISYLTFLLIRSVDVHKVGRWLDRKFGLGLEVSLPAAVAALSRKQMDSPSTSNDNK